MVVRGPPYTTERFDAPATIFINATSAGEISVRLLHLPARIGQRQRRRVLYDAGERLALGNPDAIGERANQVPGLLDRARPLGANDFAGRHDPVERPKGPERAVVVG